MKLSATIEGGGDQKLIRMDELKDGQAAVVVEYSDERDVGRIVVATEYMGDRIFVELHPGTEVWGAGNDARVRALGPKDRVKAEVGEDGKLNARLEAEAAAKVIGFSEMPESIFGVVCGGDYGGEVVIRSGTRVHRVAHPGSFWSHPFPDNLRVRVMRPGDRIVVEAKAE